MAVGGLFSSVEFTEEGEELIRAIALKKGVSRDELVRLSMQVRDESFRSLAYAKAQGRTGTLVRDGVPELLSIFKHAVNLPDVEVSAARPSSRSGRRTVSPSRATSPDTG